MKNHSQFDWVRIALVASLFCALACEPKQAPPIIESVVDQTPSEEIHLAGAAEATSLIRHLARVFSARTPGPPIIVHDSIGSVGGLSALRSGLLAGALVARPMGEKNKGKGILVARSEVVIALGTGIENRHLSVKEIVAAMEGAGTTWDSGLARRFLLTSVDEPVLQALAERSRLVAETLSNRSLHARWTRVSANETIGERVARVPGSLAVVDLGNLRLRSAPVWISRFEELQPMFIEMRVVTADVVPPRLRAFLDFVVGTDGQALVSDLGFVDEASP